MPTQSPGDRDNDALPATNPRQGVFYRTFLVATVLVAMAIIGMLLWPFRHAVLVALILATIVYPLRNRLPAFLRHRRIASSLVLTGISIIFVLIPFLAIVGLLIDDTITFVRLGVTWFEGGGMTDAVLWLQHLRLPNKLQEFIDLSFINVKEIESWALASGGDIGKWFIGAGKDILGKIAATGVQLLMLVVFLFYFLSEGEHLTVLLRKISPLRQDQEDAIFLRFKAVSQSILLGGLGTSLAIGIATGIGLWIAGINPLLWGAVSAIASLIPVIGLSIIYIASICYLVAIDSVKMAIFLFLYWIVIVNSIDNFVRPLFMRGKSRLSMLWIFVSVAGGVFLFGPIGLLYGPLALSLAFVFFQVYLDAQEESIKV